MQFADLPDDAVPAVIATEGMLYRDSSLVISVPVVFVYPHGFVVHIEVFHPVASDRENLEGRFQGHRITCAIGDEAVTVPIDGPLTAFDSPWPGYCWPISSANRHSAKRLWVARLPQDRSVRLTHTAEQGSGAVSDVTIAAGELTAAASRSVKLR